MWKQLFPIVALVLAISLQCHADGGTNVRYRGNARHPTLPNHCYYQEHELDVPIKQVLKPVDQEGLCVELECAEDYLLTIKHCPRYPIHCSSGPNDASKPFPDCCGKITCPKV